MSVLVTSGAGIVLALSFALLWQRRFGGMLVVLALQNLVVAIVAAGHGLWSVAAVELLWGAVALPWLLSRRPNPRPLPPAGETGLLAAGATLAAVSLPLGAVGAGLAVALLGGLLLAARPQGGIQVVGLGTLQAGIVLAGIAAGAELVLLAAPCLPALALAAGVEGGLATPDINRRARDLSSPARLLALLDFAGCGVLLLLACGLPWFAGTALGPWRLDPIGILAAVLVSLLACLLRWPATAVGSRGGLAVAAPDAAAPQATLPLRGTLVTAGAFVAVLADRPVLAWTGLAIATTATVATASPRQARLAGLGLGLTLFGSVTLSAAALPAGVTLLVGLACLAAAGPELAGLAALLLLRVRASLGPVHGLDALLIAAGLLALLIAIGGLASPSGSSRGSRQATRLPMLATLGQAGVAVFAFGLHTPEASFAAVLQLVLLVLTRLALELSASDGLPRVVALAGLAGLPPFGLFPSLALLLAATTARATWLMPPLLVGLAALGWLVLRGVPAGPYRLRPTIAWLPLVAVLVLGLMMPGPVGAGLHLVAEQLP